MFHWCSLLYKKSIQLSIGVIDTKFCFPLKWYACVSCRNSVCPRYSTNDWSASNVANYNISDKERSQAERLRADAWRTVKVTDQRTRARQSDATKRLGRLVTDYVSMFYRSNVGRRRRRLSQPDSFGQLLRLFWTTWRPLDDSIPVYHWVDAHFHLEFIAMTSAFDCCDDSNVSSTIYLSICDNHKANRLATVKTCGSIIRFCLIY